MKDLTPQRGCLRAAFFVPEIGVYKCAPIHYDMFSANIHFIKKKGPGRPKLENGRTGQLPGIRVTKDQFKAYQDAANAAGVGIGEWVRRVLDKASQGTAQ